MSCATPRKAATETRTQAQSSSARTIEDSLRIEEHIAETVSRIVEEQMRSVRESVATSDEATERVIEIFDTSQPVDTATGTPPLISRTSERRTAATRSENKERTEAGTALGEQAKTDITTTAEAQTSELVSEKTDAASDVVAREEKSKPPWLTAIKAVCFLTVFIGLWWLLHKVIKRFSNKH